MRKFFLTIILLMIATFSFAQRVVDKIDRGLIAMKVSGGVYLSWRVLGEEYYDVTYNVYRDGNKVNDTPLKTSNYTDKGGSLTSTYTVRPVVRGTEKGDSKKANVWTSSYKEIKLTHEGILSTLVPNDATCADVDGDGELEIIMKFDNQSEMDQSYPKNGPTVNGVVTKEYTIFECFKLDGTRLWWINCGPNMADFQNNEQNIALYDWDGDGKAEVIMRAADGTVVHHADGTTYTVGNANANVRAANGGGVNWFVTTDGEYLLYLNGETGETFDCISYPLPRLEAGETDLTSAWGHTGWAHRCSKHFFGAPYLDGRKPSIFLARGIYTRHKMAAYDVDLPSHKLKQRWKWYCNAGGPWKGQGYHNYAVADVDMDGRDEIVFGSMVIDDNGKGLSTTGLGHGDAEHVGDLNPYTHGLEIYACLEDNPGNNFRDATTSKIYHRFIAGSDDGRAMAGNFTDDFPGGLGCSAREGAISTVTYEAIDGLNAVGVNTNFRIYWDGDLCSETFNYLNGKNTEGCVAKYGSWTPIYTCAGSMTNNDTKGTPCFQGDILGDWREEIIMRTANNNIRIYSTPTSTSYRIPTLWHDHQYRNAVVWQMNGYNQPPNISYFLGKLEGITIAPPPLTMTDRDEVANKGTIGSGLNGKHVIVCETNNTDITLENGAKPYILTFNVPTWVQGTAASESTNSSPRINYTTYTCNVTGGGLAGDARLIKQGEGILNLPKADFTHTGETNIWEGTLNFDGTLKNSPLWLNRFTTLNSNGGEFRSIKADYASVIRPGGENSMGNITTDSLLLGFGSRIVVDLYSTDNASDVIKTKYLKIEKKTGRAWELGGPQYLQPVIELSGHLATGEDKIAPGKYVIAEVSGNISGNVSDITLEGLPTSKKSLYEEDGKLIVEIFGVRDAGSVVWAGKENNVWDYAETANFSINDGTGAEATIFVAGDKVTFDETASTKKVSVTGSVIPDSLIVDNTSAYEFSGDGSIDGTTAFVKKGTGTVTMSGMNSYTGGNYLKGGTTVVKALSNQYNANGNLGGITSSVNKFTFENGAVLQTTADVEQGSPMKMVGTEGGVINNSGQFLMEATLSGTTLTKKGGGAFKFNKAGNLSKLIITSGHVDFNVNNPVTTVEFQGGTLWENVQSTSFSIYVPAGKSGTIQLTSVYYTAYNNKVTGEGTLTVVPRNTVSRVRITGDWSAFKGTIKHNTSIWLPLDNSTGIPNGTLDVASGCTVTNVCRTYPIGKLTGSGALAHPIANFQNSNAVNGSNTWNVGNSSKELGDFLFAGKMHDDGGSNKCNFVKVGTCNMSVSGAWDNTGTVAINEGTLTLSSSAKLGTGALTVAAKGTLAGQASLTNSSYTINGTVIPGSITTPRNGIDFGGKNVTFKNTATLEIHLRKSPTTNATTGKIGTLGNTYIGNINTLTIPASSVIKVHFSEENQLKNLSQSAEKADSFYIASDVKTLNIASNVTLDLPELLFSDWDTSRISEGVLYVRFNPAKYNNYMTGVQTIDASETVNVTVVTLNGTTVSEYTCPMGSVKSSFSKEALAKGVYLLRIKSETGKESTIKVLK